MQLSNKKLIKHAYFGEKVTILFEGFKQIQVVDKPDFIKSLKPFIEDVKRKL